MGSPEQVSVYAHRRTLFRRPVVGGREILGRRLQRELHRHVGATDTVRLCLRGDLGQALVGLDDRLLILKGGFHAGTTFGAITTTIYYRDVTGIQTHTQLVSGWIEISSPSFSGRERKRSRQPRSSDRDVYKLPNCIPIYKRHIAAYTDALAELRRLVAGAKDARAGNDVVTGLERLATLHAQGVLGDAEFAEAKSKLITSG